MVHACWHDPSSSVQLPMVQSLSGHIHRRFRHTSRLGRPCRGRSTSSIRARSFTWAGTPHDGHPTDRATLSTWIFPTPPGPSSTPRKVMSGSPIIHTNARVGSVSTGVLHLRSLNNQRLVDPRYALADPVTAPRSFPKRQFDGCCAGSFVSKSYRATEAMACATEVAERRDSWLSNRELIAGFVAGALEE